MRKLVAMAALAVLAVGVPVLAAQTQSAAKPAPEWVKGTLTAWDAAAKTCTVKDEAGKEHSFTWNADTKVEGTPKVGEAVQIKYKADKDGKEWATHIHVGKAVSEEKKPAKKS